MGLALVIGRINMAGGITAAVVGGAAILGGAYMSSRASQSAAQTQADAANNATAANNAALERQAEMSLPYRTAGEKAVNQLSEMTQPGGAATKEFAYGPFAYQADPGYAFRLKEGMNAMNATAAARGGLISGNALKAGQIYGQEMGSQEYGNAFNRYLSNYSNAQNTFQLNRNNLLDPLKFLSGQGQASAANQAANIGANTNANAALSTGAANAQAAGQIGSANAYTNAIGQGVGAYQMNQLINRSAYGSPSNTNIPMATAEQGYYGPGLNY
jgi:hypothetical protein